MWSKQQHLEEMMDENTSRALQDVSCGSVLKPDELDYELILDLALVSWFPEVEGWASGWIYGRQDKYMGNRMAKWAIGPMYLRLDGYVCIWTNTLATGWIYGRLDYFHNWTTVFAIERIYCELNKYVCDWTNIWTIGGWLGTSLIVALWAIFVINLTASDKRVRGTVCRACIILHVSQQLQGSFCTHMRKYIGNHRLLGG